MTGTDPDLPLRVVAADPLTLQQDLDAAVRLASRCAAREGKHGILVTRHSYTEFTVDISASVPYGITLEAEQWPEPGPDRERQKEGNDGGHR